MSGGKDLDFEEERELTVDTRLFSFRSSQPPDSLNLRVSRWLAGCFMSSWVFATCV